MRSGKRALPSAEQVAQIKALASNRKLHAAAVALAEDPSSWPTAMADPRKWAQAQGVPIAGDLDFQLLNEITAPQPILPDGIGMPGPDWVPYTIQQFNCRTYWVPTKGPGPTKYEQVTICFGFTIQPNPVPGGPIG